MAGMPWWLVEALRVMGIAFGVFWGSWMWRKARAQGDTRVVYVVCPRCGRRRNKRYGVGGVGRTEEEQ